jgi:hypothetical protein
MTKKYSRCNPGFSPCFGKILMAVINAYFFPVEKFRDQYQQIKIEEKYPAQIEYQKSDTEHGFKIHMLLIRFPMEKSGQSKYGYPGQDMKKNNGNFRFIPACTHSISMPCNLGIYWLSKGVAATKRAIPEIKARRERFIPIAGSSRDFGKRL